MRHRWQRLRALSPAQHRIVVAALVLLPAVQQAREAAQLANIAARDSEGAG